MDKLLEYTDLIYKVKYINAKDCIENTLLDVEDFKLEYRITSKGFKHIEKNIIFHFVFTNLIALLRKADLNNQFKPVLYISSRDLPKNLLFLEQLKKIKKILPIPLMLGIDDVALFTGLTGTLKETNHKVMNFYSKRKVKLKEIKKYLDSRGFNTLSNTLSSVVDLKGFYY